LYALGRDALQRTLFPLGELLKSTVRKIAKEGNLPSREKPESQEICFIPDDDYVSFIESEAGDRISEAGNFVDVDGKILGRHRGIHSYTIGQRRGLGISSTSRLYVVKIDVEKNEVVLDREDGLQCFRMIVSDLVWHSPSGAEGTECTIKIRSTHSGESGKILRYDGNLATVEFQNPVKGVAAGQAAVFYDGDRVLGGGVISEGLKK
jgi:tRNA-specific 2-thiouridylase